MFFFKQSQSLYNLLCATNTTCTGWSMRRTQLLNAILNAISCKLTISRLLITVQCACHIKCRFQWTKTWAVWQWVHLSLYIHWHTQAQKLHMFAKLRCCRCKIYGWALIVRRYDQQAMAILMLFRPINGLYVQVSQAVECKLLSNGHGFKILHCCELKRGEHGLGMSTNCIMISKTKVFLEPKSVFKISRKSIYLQNVTLLTRWSPGSLKDTKIMNLILSNQEKNLKIKIPNETKMIPEMTLKRWILKSKKKYFQNNVNAQ